MSKAKRSIILIGIALSAICALFPPRYATGNTILQPKANGGLYAPDPSHDFLFFPDFNVYHGPYSQVFPVALDGGRLLAELVLVWVVVVTLMLILPSAGTEPRV